MSLFFRRRKRTHPAWERKPTMPRMATVIAGRRHLTGVPYALPKDLSEIKRLDFQHYIYRQILHGNFLVPLTNPRAILDVGCGTGIWGKEMAQQFPTTQAYGLDLENLKESGTLPPNYQFAQGNLLEELPFAHNTFDFVHQRLILASAIPLARWSDVLKELLRVTRPGGWLELPEMGVEVQPLGTMNLTNALSGLKALYCERGATETDFCDLLQQLPGEWAALRSRMRFFIFFYQK